MKYTSMMLGSILLAISTVANAGVWYKWHATNDVAPLGIALLLEFDSATVQAGTFQMKVNEYNLNAAYPQSGLLRLVYGVRSNSRNIDWDFRSGINLPGPTILDINVAFNPGNHLTGYIYAHNFDSQFGMSTSFGNGPNFTIFEAESDAGMNGCGWTTTDRTPCFGATGQIRRIPEPSSPLLLGLGVLGFVAARRKLAPS